MDNPMIGHVGFLVDSLDESIPRFQAFYGVTEYVRYEFVPEKAWAYGKSVTDVRFQIAQMFPKEGAKLELIEVETGATTPQIKFLREKGQNIHHVAYYVEDYDAWRAYYAQMPGATIVFEIVAEDETMGRRASFYVEQAGTAGTVEISLKTRR